MIHGAVQHRQVSMGGWAILAFLALSCMPLFAQEAPPKFLDIVQERLKPNSESAYDRIEQEIARICRQLKCPNPYVALESVTGTKEVWWLNAYESEARREHVRQAYESNEALMAELRKASHRKEALVYEPVSIATTYRSDLSRESCWNQAGARFFVITILREDRQSDGCVFEASDERQFVIVPADNRQDADRKAKVAGASTTIFALQPKWSLPADDWISARPEFWGQFRPDK